ncbi:Dam family site-specific DNA-(adenine-N6)-methyltransferase [Altererythrobacter salegens]|uniref:site-specific DNA-methyltransferase (adenine-specific) n=1 Tax=Croceibacterium salegens TaxID=1737568 RepID=A0A6I4SUI1_9SPHN|nr:Dam family site-specific DNA-(adenine-N6)-methyltransferase [Croceibacterium salegens]MXO58476.1 Dam family site-specific DNA-(adenine-N6)-methyltransferase [Croceibacterium salegens]
MIETQQIIRTATPPPFLKWAGGKRWLVSRGFPAPPTFDRLVEPFVGSAAIFFSLLPERAILADVNQDLINLYRVIRDSPVELQAMLRRHHDEHSRDHYYAVRKQVIGDDLGRAARMLYLNRTCWNGLYRVNRLGEFNVPIGTKTTVLIEGEDFELYSKALSGAEIACQDFETTIDACGHGDFLFVDPPYTVKHNMNGFVKYNETIFSWDDQVRLAAALRRAGSRGAAVLVTNADHESLRELYRDDFTYTSVERQSILAGSAAHRGGTTEALFALNLTPIGSRA